MTSARFPALLAAALLTCLPGCDNGSEGDADTDADSDVDGDSDLDLDQDGDPDDAGDADIDVPIDADSEPDADDGGDGEADSDADLGPGPSGREHSRVLPFEYTRPEAGEALSEEELTEFTDRYLELLEHTRYFDFLAERVHGWPETDPDGRYFYGTWWSGVEVRREGDRVVYHHGPDGADNNGLRTAQILESACYAHLLWGDEELERLARRVTRGFISWIIAMESESHPRAGVLMTRASYPEPVVSTEWARELLIDYGENRPGIDNDATIYVHITDNPYWGDIWIKNKRSKDDIGDMLRAIAQLDACAFDFADPATLDDMTTLYELYFAWARRVEDDGFRIATYNRSLGVYLPLDTLAIYTSLGGAECTGMLALRLAGRGDPGDFDCGDGIGPGDALMDETNNSNAQILRSHHEAAAGHALLANQNDLARALVEGLASRVGTMSGRFEAGTQPDVLPAEDFVVLMLHSAAVGVPLTWREVRWLQAQFDIAHDAYLAMPAAYFDPFGDDTPDGVYSYEPGGTGVRINDVGLLLGTCAAEWRNPASHAVLDCDRIMAAGRP